MLKVTALYGTVSIIYIKVPRQKVKEPLYFFEIFLERRLFVLNLIRGYFFFFTTRDINTSINLSVEVYEGSLSIVIKSSDTQLNRLHLITKDCEGFNYVVKSASRDNFINTTVKESLSDNLSPSD